MSATNRLPARGFLTDGPHTANWTCDRSQRYRWQATLWIAHPTARSRVQLSMCYIQFSEKIAIFFVKSNNWMVFIMGKKCFICEVRTELLFLIGKKFSLQCNTYNMNLKISAHAQFCQCYQNFVSRQTFSQKYQSQIKCISDIPDAQPIPCATYLNSSFLMALLSSLSKAPLYLYQKDKRALPGGTQKSKSSFFSLW